MKFELVQGRSTPHKIGRSRKRWGRLLFYFEVIMIGDNYDDDALDVRGMSRKLNV